MSSSLMDLLQSQLGGAVMDQITQQVGGGDRRSTNRAVAAALPVLVQALSRNASSSSGASALNSALEKDHDGGILGDLAGFLGKGDTSMGDGILRHVLGNERQDVEQHIAKSSGMDIAKIGGLLATLAPVLMGAMGKTKRERGLDAGGLAEMLGGERERIEKSNDLGGLGKLLDADGDGQYMDDDAKIGSSLLGGLFGKR